MRPSLLVLCIALGTPLSALADQSPSVDAQIESLVQRGFAELNENKLFAPPGDNAFDTLNTLAPLIGKGSPEAQKHLMVFMSAAGARNTSNGPKPTPAPHFNIPAPAPTAAAPPSSPPPAPVSAPPKPPPDAAPLLAKGDARLAEGQIAGARDFYRLAAEQGSAEAARRMAQTYDPTFLGQHGALGLRGEPEKKRAWMDRAKKLDAK